MSLASSRPESSTADLTGRMAIGDELAFREFHDAYFNRLFRHILVLTRGNETQARDVLQDTLCRVARYVRAFENEQVFWCWLTAVARSAVHDAGRKQFRYWTMLQNYTLRWLQPLLSSDEEADRQLEALLQSSLNDLDPVDRALIEGKYLKKSPVRVLAAETGLTAKAVESRLARSRRHLRDLVMNKLRTDSL